MSVRTGFPNFRLMLSSDPRVWQICSHPCVAPLPRLIRLDDDDDAAALAVQRAARLAFAVPSASLGSGTLLWLAQVSFYRLSVMEETPDSNLSCERDGAAGLVRGVKRVP